MSGKGKGQRKTTKSKKKKKKSVSSGSKRKASSESVSDKAGDLVDADEIRRGDKRQRGASAPPSPGRLDEPSTATTTTTTTQPVAFTIARSPLNPIQAEPPTSPPIPGTPTLQSDEEKLPALLPNIPRKTAVLLRAVRVFVNEYGIITGGVPTGQIIRHTTDASDTSLVRRAAAAAATCAAVDNPGAPAASELAMNHIYIPTDVIPTTTNTCNVVLKVTRLSDNAVFAMKLMPGHENEEGRSHWGTYFAERVSVLHALRGCDWQYIVPQYGICESSRDTPCTTVRMKLMGNNLADELETRRFAAHEVVMTIGDVLGAIAHVHSRGIIHGAVSATNFLFDTDSRQYKISDFESAAVGTENGTPGKRFLVASSARDLSIDFKDCKACANHDLPVGYHSPDHSSQTRTAGFITSGDDMWCVGVILYMMVTNSNPFSAGTHSEMQSVLAAHFADETRLYAKFRDSAGQSCGFDGKQLDDLCELLAQLLRRLPSDRIDAEGALNSNFFKRRQRAAAAAAAAAAPAAAPAASCDDDNDEDIVLARCAGAGMDVKTVVVASAAAVAVVGSAAAAASTVIPESPLSFPSPPRRCSSNDPYATAYVPNTPLHAPADEPNSPPRVVSEDSFYNAPGFHSDYSPITLAFAKSALAD